MLFFDSFAHEPPLRRLGLVFISLTWALPNVLVSVVAVALVQLLGGRAELWHGAVLVRWRGFRSLGGVCLGAGIIVSDRFDVDSVWHEWGHFRQHLRLGPFYYLVIGIPSVLHALYFLQTGQSGYRYFHFYTEAWADALGGVYENHRHKYPTWTGYVWGR